MMFEAKRKPAAFALTAISSLMLAACGGGGSGSSATTTPSSEARTLASCLSPTPGKKFTGTYTSSSGQTFTQAFEILAGTYGGANATLEKTALVNADGSLSSTYSTNYAIYTSTRLYSLARIRGNSSTSSTYEEKFSGYDFDLSKKIGEVQTISGVETAPDGSTTTSTITLSFEGMETLSLASRTLNTCRIKIDETSGTDTSRVVVWIAPGYGFWSPVKETDTVISGTDAGQTGAFIMTSTN